MTSAVTEDVPTTAGERQLSSHTDVKTNVTGFYDAPTGSIQYIVIDPGTRKCAVIDPVLDFDPNSGSTRTTSADRLLSYIEAMVSLWNGFSTPIRTQIIFLPPVI
jgi:glyoxylase-like metal-dependent hydrolase (beta-lactamase superfamily II)